MNSLVLFPFAARVTGTTVRVYNSNEEVIEENTFESKSDAYEYADNYMIKCAFKAGVRQDVR